MNLGALLTQKTGPLPNWVWGSVAVVGLGIGFYVMKRQQSSIDTASTTAPPDTSTAGYADTGTDGHEVLIVPMGNYQTSNTPDNTQRSSGRTGSNSRPIPPKQIATVRNRYSVNIPSVMDYDKVSPNGVPVRPVPGSSLEVYKVAYGSTIEILGPPQQGPSNVKETGLGSTSWYPVTGGYLSAMDVTGVAQSYSNTVQQTNNAPQTTQQSSTNSGSTTQYNTSTSTVKNT
jgi:hypothetical protein